MEEAASSSHHLVADPDPAAMQLDSDDAMLSRSNSVQPLTEGENGTDIRSLSRRDKGKGKERDDSNGHIKHKKSKKKKTEEVPEMTQEQIAEAEALAAVSIISASIERQTLEAHLEWY